MGSGELRAAALGIFRRDAVLPEWEAIPYDLTGEAAEEQRRGFHARASKPIICAPVPFKTFPAAGIFGHARDWFSDNEIACYASFDGEDLLLIQNTWHGFPDPPEWGLASRPAGTAVARWAMWGHFPKLPTAWTVPVA